MREHGELVKLDLNITNRCNLRCRHCCLESGIKQMDDLPFAKIEEVLSEFVRIGGKRIDITGGECTLHGDIKRIIALARRLRLKVELVTNGTAVTEADLDFWQSLGVDEVAISIDGHNAQTYNHIRRRDGATFNRVQDVVRGCVKRGIGVQVNTVIFASNMGFAPEMVQMAIDLGAKSQSLYFFSPLGNGRSQVHEVADPIEWLKVIRTKLFRFTGQIKLAVEMPVVETAVAKTLSIGCFMRAPWHLQVLPTGNVYPCAIMAVYDKSLGNVFQSRLIDLWNDPDLRSGRYYEQHIKPLIERDGGCVRFTGVKELIDSGKYSFVCPYSKYRIEELMP